MYQINNVEAARERHRETLDESERRRLALQLSRALPKRDRSRSSEGGLRRKVVLLFFAMGLTILLVATAAHALDIQCPSSVGAQACMGTDEADVMKDTREGDTIVGLGAQDRLTDDGNAAKAPGDDRLFGGAGSDRLSDEEGDDAISADFLFGDGTDAVEGGPGNDTIRVVEGQRDVIDCGPGEDCVQFDAGLDSVQRCEIKEAH